MYCKAQFTVLAPSTYGGALTFSKLVIDAAEYNNTGAAISFYDIPTLKTFLNNLNIGAWSVLANGSDGLIIKLLNFTDEKTIVLTGLNSVAAEVNFSPTYIDCADSINGDSCEDACFENFIGLKDICEPATKNCIWLNDAGVNSKTLEDLITKDYSDIKEFFEDKRTFAIRQITANIYSHFQNQFKAVSIIEDARIGFLNKDKTVVASPTGKAGLVLDLKNCSDYLKFYASKISLITNFTGTIIIEVWDVYQNKLIDEIPVDSIAGQVSFVEISKIFQSLKEDSTLAFVYDTTGINSYKVTAAKGMCCGKKPVYNSQYFSAYGVQIEEGDDVIHENLNMINDTAGMSMIYSIQCDHKSWICANANKIALPILYKTCEVLYFHGETTSKDQRVNNKVTINSEELKRLRLEYASLADNALGNILGAMNPPNDARCFYCNDRSRIINVLP